MLSTILIIVVMLLWCVVHSYTATNRMKIWTRERFGPETDRWYRFAYNSVSVLTAIPVLWLKRSLPDSLIYLIPLPWPILLLVIQSIGFIIIVMGVLQLGTRPFAGIQALFSKDQPAEISGFVQTGIYGWIRHPLYLGGLLIIWPATGMSVNLLALLIIATIYIVVGAKLEEKRYVEEFGEAYVKYQQEVPMLVPDLRRLVKQLGNNKKSSEAE